MSDKGTASVTPLFNRKDVLTSSSYKASAHAVEMLSWCLKATNDSLSESMKKAIQVYLAVCELAEEDGKFFIGLNEQAAMLDPRSPFEPIYQTWRRTRSELTDTSTSSPRTSYAPIAALQRLLRYFSEALQLKRLNIKMRPVFLTKINLLSHKLGVSPDDVIGRAIAFYALCVVQIQNNETIYCKKPGQAPKAILGPNFQ